MKKKEECGHVSPSSISGDSDTNCEETDSESVIVEKSPLTTNASTPTEEYCVDSPDDPFFFDEIHNEAATKDQEQEEDIVMSSLIFQDY